MENKVQLCGKYSTVMQILVIVFVLQQIPDDVNCIFAYLTVFTHTVMVHSGIIILYFAWAHQIEKMMLLNQNIKSVYTQA